MSTNIKIVASRRDPASRRIYDATDYDVELPDGRVVTWACIEGPDIAVVLAIDKSMNVYMKREWRLSQKREVLELVSGRIDTGETPLQCAHRELKEEIGIQAKEMIFLEKLSMWNHSAVHAHLFLARDLTIGENRPDQDEFLKLERVPFSSAVEQARSVGTNAQTLVSLFLAKHYLNTGVET